MKYKLGLLIIVVILFKTATAQTKHALIFAIGNYPEKNGWIPLSSLNDTLPVKTSLLNQGFEEKNIRVYTDTQVSVTGINNAFRDLLKDKSLKKGDIVVIHYSGHGEQVEDDNGDEVDRLDESLVTYKAVSPLKANKKDYQKNQQEYFRDDQFGKWINQLRDTLGRDGDILVFIDACHSGSGTRGNVKVRGSLTPLVSADFDPGDGKTVDINSVFLEKNSKPPGPGGLATYVVISAAMSGELDYEAKGKPFGSLSYAIGKSFAQLAPGTTYRALFANIQSVMNEVAPNQHPVIEGDGVDRVVFNKSFIPQKPYVEIESIKGNRAIIQSGTLAGLGVGAKIIICKHGTNDPAHAKSLAAGAVISADYFSSIVKLDKDPGLLHANEGCVFVTEPVYDIEPINVKMVAASPGNTFYGFSQSEMNDIIEKMKDQPLIQFDGEPELLVNKGEIKDCVSIRMASNGQPFDFISAQGPVPDELKKVIKRYSRYKFLRDVNIKDPAADIEVRLVPLINKKADTSAIESKIVNGVYEFKEGDRFVLWVKNKTSGPVYINILDLQPDGFINKIFPNKEARDVNGNISPIYPNDLLINPNASVLFSQYPVQIFPPFGTEIFKIFVSPNLIDLEGISDSPTATTRGNFTLLTRLVKDSHEIAARGPAREDIGNADGSVYSLLFRIIPK